MPQRLVTYFSERFGSPPESMASAPGRIEFLGNHTDYNGGKVIGAAIGRRVFVGVSQRTDGACQVASNRMGGEVHAIDPATGHVDDWTRYVLGVIRAMPERPEHPSGVSVAVLSDLTMGAGLASSAALEVAVAAALNNLWRLNLPPDEIVGIAHRAETEYVGVPCGLLDQTVVVHARRNRLVMLNTATQTIQLLPVPDGARFWIFRTHESHRLAESLYGIRREECERARIGLRGLVPGLSHLASLHPFDLETYGDRLEETSAKRAAHVLGEQARVVAAESTTDAERLGALLFESHASSRALFENSTDALDFLVEQLHRREGVLGARLTGGGFGGAVIALTTDAFSQSEAERIADAYRQRFDETCEWWQMAISEGVRVEGVS